MMCLMLNYSAIHFFPFPPPLLPSMDRKQDALHVLDVLDRPFNLVNKFRDLAFGHLRAGQLFQLAPDIDDAGSCTHLQKGKIEIFFNQYFSDSGIDFHILFRHRLCFPGKNCLLSSRNMCFGQDYANCLPNNNIRGKKPPKVQVRPAILPGVRPCLNDIKCIGVINGCTDGLNAFDSGALGLLSDIYNSVIIPTHKRRGLPIVRGLR